MHGHINGFHALGSQEKSKASTADNVHAGVDKKQAGDLGKSHSEVLSAHAAR
jgi:hypothetical protein